LNTDLSILYEDSGIGTQWVEKNMPRVLSGEITLDQFFEEQKNARLNSPVGDLIKDKLEEKENYEYRYGVYDRDAYDLYQNTAGEIEAREVQKRMNMSPEERKANIPFVKDEKTVFNEPYYNRLNGIVKYSLTTNKDSQGRTLTPQQQEYFKDTKMVDKNGNLEVMYHSGKSGNYNVIDFNRTGENTGYDNTAFGYFITNSKAFSERFKDIDNEGNKGYTREFYANIKKPIIHPYQAWLKYEGEELDNIIKNYYQETDNLDALKSLEEQVKLNNDGSTIADIYAYLSTYEESPFEDALKEKEILQQKGYDAVEFIEGEESYIAPNSKNNDIVSSYAVFDSNQIKLTDNTNPTSNEDIRKSLTSNENIDSKEIAPIGSTVEETIAPIREDLSNITEQMNNLSNQIQTLQNRAEMVPNNDIAPVRPSYREMQRANALNNTEISPEEAYKDENYWKSVEESAEQTSDLDEKSARKLSRNVGKELGLKQKQIKDLQNIIQTSFDKGYSLQEIKNELERQFGHQTVTERLQDVIEAQNELRNVRIKVSPEIQKDITDYGYWKQKYFGKIKFSSEGTPVDVAYAQLSEQNPGMYPSNIINPTDQLLRIAEVADMDRKYTMDYEMDRNTIDEAANYINDTIQETMYANAMKSQTNLEENAMQYNERTNDIPYKKKTRAQTTAEIQNDMGITTDDLSVGKDIGSIQYNLTSPERVNEKVFGREIGRKINEQTVFFAKHQEAERIRFLNKERQEIKDLGIKARSKESALVQQYGEGIIGDSELAQQVENKVTQEKIKNAAKVLRSKYDTYLDQINEELVDMGYDPIPKRKDYMRHFQELNDKFSQAGIPFNRQALNAENLPTDINGLTEFNVPGKNWFASALHRTGEQTTYDAITGIDGYLEGASNLMYHTETIQRYRALEKLIRDTYGQQHGLDLFGDDLSSEEAMQRIKDIQDGKLSNYAAWLKEQGNAIAGKKGALDRGTERFLGRRGYTLASELKKQVGSNMTGFNVRSALTNFISSTIAASKTNKIAMVRGTIDTIQNIFHDDGFINKSDFLTSRFGSDSLSQKTWQKISNAGQILMSGSDWFTSNLITRSKYYEGLQKGMTDSQAMAYANDFAARVMGDRSKGATAEAFNSKTLGFLTQFQLETNNQWQYMIHDTKMEYQENLAKDGGLKAGATLLFQVGQLGAFSYLFNEMFEQLTGSRAAFDFVDIIKKLFGLDPEDKDKDFETRMKEAGSELVDALPFASLFGSGGRLPIGEMLTPAQTVYDYITGGTNQYGQEITLKDVGKDTLETIPYYVLPTGYGQIKKTIGGLEMYNNEVPGSYTDSGNLRFTADTDTGSIIKNALFGKWADDEAREYRESGYKTISEKNIEEMTELEMNSSEYRDYRTGLTAAGTKKADKIDYISNLDLPINKKNIMASNVLNRDVDMSNYKKFSSYEEFDYAYKNPEKHKVITTITSYDNYKEIQDRLKTIRNNTKEDKKETIAYINSLDLTIPQKAMFIKQYYPSFNQYNKEIANYIANSDMSYEDKIEILNQLKFKIDDNGRISWK
jgi:hypothetical protein